MSRIYDSVVIFGVAERAVCPDLQERLAVLYEGQHPFIQRGVAAGLEWCCRDMSGYPPPHAEGEVRIYVGLRLSRVDVDAPLGRFSEEAVTRAVADARQRLAEAGFEQAPEFHHVASHSD